MRLIPFILLLLFSISSQAQRVERLFAVLLDSLPVVQGKLHHYNPDYHKDLTLNYTIVSREFKNIEQKVAEIKEDGSFNLELDHPHPNQKIVFNIGHLYKGNLIANSNLFIDIDLTDLIKKVNNYANKAIVYSGDDAKMNQFYNEYVEYKVDKKSEIRKAKLSAMMNRTSQPKFKIGQIREYFEALEKIDDQFAKKNWQSFRWFLENERKSEMYGDIAYVFIGRPIDKELWTECLNHYPKVVTELSNRFYGMLALKLWSHEEREVRSLSRLIYKSDLDDPEEAKEVDVFMNELDKKKAGLSYDNEVFSKGLDRFAKKYAGQVEDAKLNLYIEKLSMVPEDHVGLIGIKGQPLDLEERVKYLDKFLPIVRLKWQKDLITQEFDEFKEWKDQISEDMKSIATDGDAISLGELEGKLPSGARLWNSNANDIKDLMRQLKHFADTSALIVYLWNVDCKACYEELLLSGRTHDKLEGEPLKIVTLAMNKNDDKIDWKEILVETYAPGDHVFLSKKLSSALFSYFQLPPVPAYLYFDAEGNFKPNHVFSISSLDVSEVLEEGVEAN